MANHLCGFDSGPRQGAARLAGARGMRATVGLLAVIVLAVTGCGGGGSAGNPGSSAGNPGTSPPAAQGTTSGSQPAAACQLDGSKLRISARGDQFDQQCLAAPAGTPLVLTFQNQDQGEVHNVAIYSDPQLARTLFKGKLIQGVATIAYHLPALPAGSYFFQCDVHPQTMNGTLVVR